MAEAPLKLCYPAAARNREPILEVLREVLPAQGTVLEVAAGTGQHACFFTQSLPNLVWQPTEFSEECMASIEAWVAEADLENLRAPLRLDASNPDAWPIDAADAVFNANMIHISPWEVCLGLLAGAGRVLANGAPLCLYGPYLVEGRPTAPSNLAFDESLRSRRATWGIRWLHEVEAAAGEHGLVLDTTIDMPANNLTVVFRKR